MLINAIFLTTVFAHLCAALINFRVAIYMYFFLYAVYPRFFALGLGDEGFAFTGQRAMVVILALVYFLRLLWGSAEIRRGYELAKAHWRLPFCIIGFLGARFVGNLMTGRTDFGVFGAMISEILISLFVFVLIITYFRRRSDIVTLVAVILFSMIANQFAAFYEFAANESLFPEEIDLQYDPGMDEQMVVEGQVRAGTYRAMGFFDNALELTGLLILIFPFAVGLVTACPRFGVRVAALLATLLTLPVALFTGSRSALGAILLTIIWYLYVAVSRGMTRKGRLFFGIVGAIGGGFVVAAVATGFIQEMLFGANYVGSTNYRVLQYVYAWTSLVEQPFFGYGYARNIADIVDIRPLDSFLLRMLLEGGFVCVIFLIAAFTYSFRILGEIRESARDPFDYNIARSAAISLTAGMIVSIILSLPSDRLYFFVAMAIAVCVHQYALGTVKVREGSPAPLPGGATAR